MDSTTVLSMGNYACTITSSFYLATVYISIWASVMVFSIINIVLNFMLLSALVKNKEQFGLQSSIHISVSKCETEGYFAKNFGFIYFHFCSIYASYILVVEVHNCFEQEIYSYSILMFIVVCPFISGVVSTLLDLFVLSCKKSITKYTDSVEYNCYFRKTYLGSSFDHQNIYCFTYWVKYMLLSVPYQGWVFTLLCVVFGCLLSFVAHIIKDIMFSETTKLCITPHEEENPVPVWTEASINSNRSVERYIKSTDDFEVTSIVSDCIIKIEDSDMGNQHLLHSTWNGEPNTKKSCGVSTNYDLYPTKADHTL